MESLSGFVVFVQVAETRSFVAAGRHLGLSASAVGKRVARLEDRLGVRLFHRSTRSITLTAEGMRFLERSRRVLAEIQAAELELSETMEAPRGRLRVSMPQANGFFSPVLAEFTRAYPGVELDLDFTDRVVDVIEEGFDAVLRTGIPADSRLSVRRLGDFPLLLVASPDYLGRHGTPETPSDLIAHTCLHYRYPNTGKIQIWPLQPEPGAQDLRLPSAMVCNDIETRLHFALHGLGIAYLPAFAVNKALAEGRLCTVLDRHLRPNPDSLSLLWPSGRHVLPKLRVFIDFITAGIQLVSARRA